MPMTQDILLSQLAMDSYNRGYAPGLGGQVIQTSRIGPATFINESNTRDHSPEKDAGFYASAYLLDRGVFGTPADKDTIVISYRGTDNFNPFSPTSDVWGGWTTGLGYINSQAHLAAKFYADIRKDNPDANIILTGHSLGGGLAGFVAKLNGLEAVIFDNMAFELAAQRAIDFALRPDSVLLAEASSKAGVLFWQADYWYDQLAAERQAFRDEFFIDREAGDSDVSSISGFYLPGEALVGNRELGGQLTDVDPVGNISDAENQAVVPIVSGVFSFIELHWQQPLLIKQFADELSQNGALPTNWDDNSALNKEFFVALYSNSIAWAAGISANSTVAYKDMMSMIAYSAIDTEDGAVYGTNAIKSFFDDVDDIADFVAAAPAGAYDFAKQGLMDIAAQFSAALAKTESVDDQYEAGVIQWGASSITVDFATERTVDFEGLGNDRIIGLENVVFDTIWSAISDVAATAASGIAGLYDLFGTYSDEMLAGMSGLEVKTNAGLVGSHGDGDGLILIGSQGGDNSFKGGGGEHTNIMVGYGDENTFDISDGRNVILLDSSGANAVIDASASTPLDPEIATDPRWNIVQGTAGADTITFEEASAAPLTIVYGGGSADTFDFVDAENKGVSVYLLDIDGVTAENFLSLSPEKIDEYISSGGGDGDGYGGGVDKIVIINPDADDILKYNDAVVSSPSIYDIYDRWERYGTNNFYSYDHYGTTFEVDPSNYLESLGPYSGSGTEVKFSDTWWEWETSHTSTGLISGNLDVQLNRSGFQRQPDGSFMDPRRTLSFAPTQQPEESESGYESGGRTSMHQTTYLEVIRNWENFTSDGLHGGINLVGFNNGDFGIDVAQYKDEYYEIDYITRELFVSEWLSADVFYEDDIFEELGRIIQTVYGNEPLTVGAMRFEEVDLIEQYMMANRDLWDNANERTALELADFQWTRGTPPSDVGVDPEPNPDPEGVTPWNAVEDRSVTNQGVAIDIDVLQNDNIPTGATVKADYVDATKHGTLVWNGSEFTYTPDAGFSGFDWFNYRLRDGDSGDVLKATAPVLIKVLQAGDTGVVDEVGGSGDDVVVGSAGDDTISFLGGADNYVDADAGSDRIVFDGDADDYEIVERGDEFLATHLSTGDSVQFTGVELLEFDDGTFEVEDLISVSASWTAVDDRFWADANTPIVVDVTANDTVPTGANVNAYIWTQPQNGTIAWNGTGYTYTPNTGFTGVDWFGYGLHDGDDGDASKDGAVAVVHVGGTPDPNDMTGITVDVGDTAGTYASGSSFNDTVNFLGGNGNYVETGDGNDRIVFEGDAEDYEIIGQGEHFVITNISTGEGVQFRQVEYIQFDDDVDIPLSTIIANAGRQPGDYWFEPEPIGGLV